MMPSLRIATFQRRPLFDVEQALARLSADLRWCREQQVQLALFPECYLQGYATDRATIAQRALATDSAPFQRVLALLAPFDTDIVLGFAEQRADTLYNSAAVLRGGALLGVYAKTHPNEAGFSAGQDYPVFERGPWRYGVNICNDANFADAALRISAQGAHLLCYPLNNLLSPASADRWRDKSPDNLRRRALDTGCWVISSDVVGEHGGKISHGCSRIVRPDGSLAAQVEEGREGVATCDIV